MSDNLRDRIAAAVVIHADYVSNSIRHCACGEWSGDSQTTRIGFAAHVADAVIEALRLEVQQVIEQESAAIIHGYVTEWETEDE